MVRSIIDIKKATTLKTTSPVEPGKLGKTPTRKRSPQEIWDEAKRVSGKAIVGMAGFWGSGALKRHPEPLNLVSAFVDALRAEKYSDRDIVEYGDWSDGRHMMDNVDYPHEDDPKLKPTTYKEFYAIVKRNARPVEEIREESNKKAKDIFPMDPIGDLL